MFDSAIATVTGLRKSSWEHYADENRCDNGTMLLPEGYMLSVDASDSLASHQSDTAMTLSQTMFSQASYDTKQL